VIAVAHLVWGPLGPAPLCRFLDSYARHGAGVEHELVVLFNGVTPATREPLEAALQNVPHRVLELERPVQDLDAYVQAAARLEHERLCFMNSYSEILVDGWLAKLDVALAQPRAGMAGATGSWASLHSAVLNTFFLPNPYLRTMPPRSITRQQMFEIEVELGREREGAAAPGEQAGRATLAFRASSIARAVRTMPEQLLLFERFPSYHLRTNTFMIDRTLFSSLRARPVKRKMDAYLMESGRHSFTRQVQRKGLRTLVVDRDGTTYDRDSWDSSRTLWQGDQEGLLVADNQTRSYQHGGLDRRHMLATLAWGPNARPTARREVTAR
jgi:hypothetical protein